jgi:hypothetical protein
MRTRVVDKLLVSVTNPILNVLPVKKSRLTKASGLDQTHQPSDDSVC